MIVAFAAVAALIFAFQVVSQIVIFQVTFGFANETFYWRMLSSALIAVIVAAAFAQTQKPNTASE